MQIPIRKPFLGAEEIEAAGESIRSGWVSQGPKVKEFEAVFAEATGAKYALATTSCTTALHLALVALGIGPEDEVLVPSFTFVATANAVEYCGAKPVFVDIDLATFNINPELIRSKITPKAKAIIPVHLFGLSADMDPIMSLAEEFGLRVVEDAACATGTVYKGRHVGTIGDVGCFSFHPRKTISTGEGGMVISNDAEITRKMEVMRSHGAEISDLERHQKSGFVLPEFNLLGYNYRMTDVQAAMGVEQLRRLNWIIERHTSLSAYYNEKLSNVPGIQIPIIPQWSNHSYQSYVLMLDGRCINRDRVAESLAAMGVATRQGTHAVHTLGYYCNKYGLQLDSCPMARYAQENSLAIPIYPQMTQEEQDYVVACLLKSFKWVNI